MTTYQETILEKLLELLTLIDYEEIVRDYRENLVSGNQITTKTVEININGDINSLTADLIIDYSTDEETLETTINEVKIESAFYVLHYESLSEINRDLEINTSNDIIYLYSNS